MLHLSDKDFRQIVSEAIDSLPEHLIANMKNVAVVVEDEPSDAQKLKLHVYKGDLLFGLYEGLPLTRRLNYNLVLPDKITIFKNPFFQTCSSRSELKAQVKRTVWHEIAHHYGLNHEQINRLLEKS
jgi:predicted Zn-dependent protease with MMP-like domain